MPSLIGSRLSWLRSLLPPTVAWVVFAFLLSSVVLLSQPFPQTTISSKVGWQSWDVIELSSQRPIAANKTTEGGGGTVGDGAEEDDEDDDGWVGDVALPLDSWDPLLPHSTGREKNV